MDNLPCIIEETPDFAVVYKPPKMHSVPLKKGGVAGTLLDWYADNAYADNALPDSGLMHRLDFETHGLVLFAKNQKSYSFFKKLQDSGEFVKEYSAVCKTFADSVSAEGFPPSPDINMLSPFVIESYFRPFGTGRKLVRPVTEVKKYHEIAKDNGGFYRTEITGINGDAFTVRIRRGFRHQIRCHLCWIGYPILNDPLYNNNSSTDEPLALRAHGLFFTDPSTGDKRKCCIETLT